MSVMLLTVATCILSYILCHLPISAEGFCSSDFENDPEYPYRKYHTTTAYEDSGRGDITLYRVPYGCEPLGMVLLVRHGSRHRPTFDEAEKFGRLETLRQNLNATGAADMCPKDLEEIGQWRNWYHPGLKEDLTDLGYREMIELGKRFAKTFPQLFSETSRVKYYSSNYQRTRESARVFMEHTSNSSQPIIINDTIIFGLAKCDRFMKEVWINENILAEKNKFANGHVFVKMASDIAKRLGVPLSEIDINTLNTLYFEGCAEQVAVDGNDSPWCRVFTREDLDAFEYRDDLDSYVRHGFGTELSYKSGCVTKRFLLDALKNISDDNNASHFLNGHGWMLLRLLADMKLIENEGPFKAEEYPERLNRTFKKSEIAANGANLAFLVNECGGKKKLQVFHNERKLDLPLNNPVTDGTWDLDAALEYFGYNDPNDCNFKDMCSLDPSTTASPM